MAAYPLAPLLTVRLFREEAAKNAVRRAEAALKESEAAAKAVTEQLARYRTWHAEEVDRRYAAIMEKSLRLAELDDFKSGLAALDVAERQREEAVEEALQQVAQRRTGLEAAREGTAQARREAAKIETHREIWLAQEAAEHERKEELEMEDSRPSLNLHAAGLS